MFQGGLEMRTLVASFLLQLIWSHGPGVGVGGSSKVAEIHSLNLHSLGGEHSWGDLEWLCGGQAWEAQPGPREAHEKGRPHRAQGRQLNLTCSHAET